MSGNRSPANVGSNDGLGPLPEYATEFRPRWPGDEGGFTGAQMRLYATTEVAKALDAQKEKVTKRCNGWCGTDWANRL